MGSTVSRGADNEDCGPLGDIPEELIKAEIVSRLPVISLMRFRCVCKSWKRLLSGDPNFVQSHLTNYSMNLNNGSLIARSFPFVNPNIIHPLNSGYVDFGGSVHGLVCVHSYNLKKRSIDYVGLWNPATNHYKDIPIPPCSANARIPGLQVACIAMIVVLVSISSSHMAVAT
ncbi:hypothetical protein POM88_051349 [Heracleum sosnowskyi]|uniref:F-box domain-containing protein n=1 Tax=Heracleum sosnowskyi TaxID=360622 RepID=A0AAD8H1Q7_9APIA|nr:hypothetical protein POM88_051349 [Heracleum sosnowskyi]